MVKGNWERRAELSVIRREKEKERKAAKKAGVKSAQAVAASLLAREGTIEELESLQCFCFAEGLQEVCSEYLRTGDCSHVEKKSKKKEKACKYGHDTECLRDVFDSSSIDLLHAGTESTEQCVVGPFDLRALSSKRHHNLAFIGVNGSLVYDHKYPYLWVNSKYNIAKSRGDSITLDADSEGGSGRLRDDSLGEGDVTFVKCAAPPAGKLKEEGENEGEEGRGGAVVSMVLFKVLKRNFDCVCSYLSSEEVATTKSICRKTKEAVQTSGYLRERLREAKAQHAATLSKKKKADKKKKTKAAGMGTKMKVDGFARGGATGT